MEERRGISLKHGGIIIGTGQTSRQVEVLKPLTVLSHTGPHTAENITHQDGFMTRHEMMTVWESVPQL